MTDAELRAQLAARTSPPARDVPLDEEEIESLRRAVAEDGGWHLNDSRYIARLLVTIDRERAARTGESVTNKSRALDSEGAPNAEE